MHVQQSEQWRTYLLLAERGDHLGRALGVEVKAVAAEGARDHRHPLQLRRERELAQNADLERDVLCGSNKLFVTKIQTFCAYFTLQSNICFYKNTLHLITRQR